MKKFLSLLLVFTLLLTCVACGKTDSTDSTTTSTTVEDSSIDSNENESEEEEKTTKNPSKEESTTLKEEVTTKPNDETTTKKDSTTTEKNNQTETTTKKPLFPNWPFGGSDKTTTTTKPIVTETTTKKPNTKPTTTKPATSSTTTTAKPNATLTTAEIINLVNTTTAKAAKGSYKLTRTGIFTKGVDFGSATSLLQSVIQSVDPNATLDSVIGGIFGIGTKTCNVANGRGDIDYKYLMKAMTLTSSDVTSATASGNKYTIIIKNCSNPSSGSPLAHATNDYITTNEINSYCANLFGPYVSVSSGQFNYTSIVINATIDNGVLTTLDYSYLLDFRIDLKLSGVGATGTGGAKITNKYTNIQY